jgi:hypothetical protein
MTTTLQDASLQLALENALIKQSRELKKDIIIWFLYKKNSDAYIDKCQIEELATTYSIEENLANVYDK